MPIPSTAKRFDQPLDPQEVKEYKATISQGADSASILSVGENVASFTVGLPAESIAAGLKIMSGNGYSPVLIGLVVTFWVQVDSTMGTASLFNGDGTELGVEITIVTDSSPARTRQKTVVIRGVQQ